MKTTHRRGFASRVGIGATTLAMLVPALLVTAGAASASAPPNVVQVRTTASVTLPDGGGALTTVESIDLGKGSWTVTSNATVVNFGAGDYVRCQLAGDGTLIDGGSTTYLSNRVGGLVDTATWKASGASTVTLRCDHDHAAASPGQFYLDPGVTLTAVRGGPIKSPNLHTKATPIVAEARSTAAVSLVINTLRPVTSMKLPVGTWAVTANASAVEFTAFDWASCGLTVGNGANVTSTYPFVGVNPTDATVSSITVEGTATIPAAGAKLTLTCYSSYGNGLSIDPGATLTATLVPQAANLFTQTVNNVDLPDSGGLSTDVVSQTMPPGAWRIHTEVISGLRSPNGAYGSGNDFVRCGLWADDTRIDGGATILAQGGVIEQIVDAGTFTSNVSWQLHLSCAHDHVAPDTDHWTMLEGTAQAIQQGPIATAN